MFVHIQDLAGTLGLFCNSHNFLTIPLMMMKFFQIILKLYSLNIIKRFRLVSLSMAELQRRKTKCELRHAGNSPSDITLCFDDFGDPLAKL